MHTPLDKEMKCFMCGKEIEGLKSFLALDRPYVNLPFHRDCYTSIDDELEYCKENYERIMDHVEALDVADYKRKKAKYRRKSRKRKKK